MNVRTDDKAVRCSAVLRDDTEATIKRLPPQYRFIVEKAIRTEIRDALATGCDAAICATVLTLIEKLGFGKKRIQRFIDQTQEYFDAAADFYGQGIAYGLINKIRNYGIDYDIPEERGKRRGK